MIKLGFRSIATKMTLLVLAGAGTVLTGILLYGYEYNRKVIFEEAKLGAINLTKALANKLDGEFRAAQKTAQCLACAMETDGSVRKNPRPLLETLVLRNPEAYGSAVAYEPYEFDSNIKMFAPYCYKGIKGLTCVSLGSDDYDYFQKDWYHIPRELKKPLWSEPYYDEGGGNALMTTYSVPVFTRDSIEGTDRVKAIVTVDLSLDRLTDMVSSIKVEDTGYCLLISGLGTFVTHPDRGMIMRQSIFSLAEERNLPEMRRLGRTMLASDGGFMHIGSIVTHKDAYLSYHRIPSTGWSLAAVFPSSEVFEEVGHVHRVTGILSILGLGLILLVSLAIAASLTRPLRRITAAAIKIGEGDLTVDVSSIRGRDEVARLAQEFQKMIQGLKQRDFIRDTFGRYITKEVVNRLLESHDGLRLGGEKRLLSILMSDLRGFTAATANMAPEQVITFLNRYLGKMVEVLLNHGGVIDEIIGDGILAFFGAPETMDDHAARAVACAIAMQLEMEGINAANEADGLPHIEMGIAVNTGEVVVGNIGSERRTKYGAVGAEVNFTGRIESFTVGGQILISDATRRLVSDIVEIGRTIEVEMKGMREKVTLYEVTGIGGPYRMRLHAESHTLAPLIPPVAVLVRRLDAKTVSERENRAMVTHASSVRARIVGDSSLNPWENVKITLLEGEAPVVGDIYGKVVSVREDEGPEAEIRFTSISSAAGAFLRARTQKRGAGP
jgi:sigma-B regulation protein RsbU (phosphoserine phosphatase)